MKNVISKVIEIDGVDFIVELTEIAEAVIELDFAALIGGKAIRTDRQLVKNGLKGKQNPLKVIKAVMEIFVQELVPAALDEYPEATFVAEAEPKRAKIYRRFADANGAMMIEWEEEPSMLELLII